MSKVLIIGDVMLDHNLIATCSKIANEYPIPIFNIKNSEYKLGGAGNVAKNINILIDNIELVFIAGNDNNNELLQTQLNKYNIKYKCFIDKQRNTTIKNRIFVDNKLVSRFDMETTDEITEDIEKEIIDYIKTQYNDIKYIVISDYKKGLITDGILHFCRYMNSNGKYVFVDPKRSNADDYKDFFLIKPNINEFRRLYFNCNEHELETHTINYITKYNNKFLIVTLGKNGICCANDNNFYINHNKSESVIDVTGAGDTCLSILVYCFYNNINIETTLHMCNYFCQKAVKTIGNYTINHSHILKYLNNQCEKIISLKNIDTIRNKYSNIVFTNGCFDILHKGHISYLKKARELGDILILGLNTDESIKRNKGEDRPFNKLEDRIFMLEQYNFIDYIIPFSEDTPINIIKKLKPTYLVKGGDYNIENIIGQEYADNTVLIDFIEGFSSTKSIHHLTSQ